MFKYTLIWSICLVGWVKCTFGLISMEGLLKLWKLREYSLGSNEIRVEIDHWSIFQLFSNKWGFFRVKNSFFCLEHHLLAWKLFFLLRNSSSYFIQAYFWIIINFSWKKIIFFRRKNNFSWKSHFPSKKLILSRQKSISSIENQFLPKKNDFFEVTQFLSLKINFNHSTSSHIYRLPKDFLQNSILFHSYLSASFKGKTQKNPKNQSDWTEYFAQSRQNAKRLIRNTFRSHWSHWSTLSRTHSKTQSLFSLRIPFVKRQFCDSYLPSFHTTLEYWYACQLTVSVMYVFRLFRLFRLYRWCALDVCSVYTFLLIFVYSADVSCFFPTKDIDRHVHFVSALFFKFHF